MKKYNLSSIMKKAWELVKKYGYTMSVALKKAWSNAKAIIKAVTSSNTNEECHTWYGWKMLGYEVIHESRALFQVTVSDEKTASGYRTLSYFGKSQVNPIQ